MEGAALLFELSLAAQVVAALEKVPNVIYDEGPFAA